MTELADVRVLAELVSAKGSDDREAFHLAWELSGREMVADPVRLCSAAIKLVDLLVGVIFADEHDDGKRRVEDYTKLMSWLDGADDE